MWVSEAGRVSGVVSRYKHETGIGSQHEFKKVGDDLWSVRVGRAYRALGRFEGDLLVWVWIGSHAEYDQVLR